MAPIQQADKKQFFKMYVPPTDVLKTSIPASVGDADNQTVQNTTVDKVDKVFTGVSGVSTEPPQLKLANNELNSFQIYRGETTSSSPKVIKLDNCEYNQNIFKNLAGTECPDEIIYLETVGDLKYLAREKDVIYLDIYDLDKLNIDKRSISDGTISAADAKLKYNYSLNTDANDKRVNLAHIGPCVLLRIANTAKDVAPYVRPVINTSFRVIRETSYTLVENPGTASAATNVRWAIIGSAAALISLAVVAGITIYTLYEWDRTLDEAAAFQAEFHQRNLKLWQEHIRQRNIERAQNQEPDQNEIETSNPVITAEPAITTTTPHTPPEHIERRISITDARPTESTTQSGVEIVDFPIEKKANDDDPYKLPWELPDDDFQLFPKQPKVFPDNDFQVTLQELSNPTPEDPTPAQPTPEQPSPTPDGGSEDSPEATFEISLDAPQEIAKSSSETIYTVTEADVDNFIADLQIAHLNLPIDNELREIIRNILRRHGTYQELRNNLILKLIDTYSIIPGVPAETSGPITSTPQAGDYQTLNDTDNILAKLRKSGRDDEEIITTMAQFISETLQAEGKLVSENAEQTIINQYDAYARIKNTLGYLPDAIPHGTATLETRVHDLDLTKSELLTEIQNYTSQGLSLKEALLKIGLTNALLIRLQKSIDKFQRILNETENDLAELKFIMDMVEVLNFLRYAVYCALHTIKDNRGRRIKPPLEELIKEMIREMLKAGIPIHTMRRPIESCITQEFPNAKEERIQKALKKGVKELIPDEEDTFFHDLF
ncbi:MAG: hypothetical protein JW841_04610 [Deltaproteobacteria bacterium]|nr:hypothetical protein [Deltaproteobacteria bacterium]